MTPPPDPQQPPSSRAGGGRTFPPVAVFVSTALILALTAGFGLGVLLLFARLGLVTLVKAAVRGVIPAGDDAADAIIRAGRDLDVDLIVVGSRGRGLVASMFLGSTTRSLAAQSPLPLLVVRARSGLRNVLVAYDGSPAARAALALVRSLPLPPGARLTVASVLPLRDWADAPVSASPEVRALQEQIERQDRIAAAALLNDVTNLLADGRSNEVLIEPAPVPEAILERARETQADLIVLGSRGLAGPRRLFWGSTAEHVGTTAGCPVLIVPVASDERIADGVRHRS